jgi:hypothetical protein
MTAIGKVIGSVLKSTGLRKVAQNGIKVVNKNTFAKMFAKSAKANTVYSKDVMQIKDLAAAPKADILSRFADSQLEKGTLMDFEDLVIKKESPFTRFVNAEAKKGNVVNDDDIFKMVKDNGNGQKPMTTRVRILKSFQERFNHALDFLKYRNPADFVSKSEVEQNMGKLLKAKSKTLNVGLFKGNISHKTANYIDTEIRNCRKLLKILD